MCAWRMCHLRPAQPDGAPGSHGQGLSGWLEAPMPSTRQKTWRMEWAVTLRKAQMHVPGPQGCWVERRGQGQPIVTSPSHAL